MHYSTYQKCYGETRISEPVSYYGNFLAYIIVVTDIIQSRVHQYRCGFFKIKAVISKSDRKCMAKSASTILQRARLLLASIIAIRIYVKRLRNKL